MSKLSLSYRLLSSKEEPASAEAGSDVSFLSKKDIPPALNPAAEREGSPLSGWSDGNAEEDHPATQGNSPEKECTHLKSAAAVDGAELESYLDIEADTLAPDINDFYGDDDDEDDDDHAGFHSEIDEEEPEPTEELEGEEEVEEDDDEGEVINLCQSEPSSQQLDAAGASEQSPEIESCICQVCGMNLTSKHYLQQVQHVKQCLSKRHLQGGAKAKVAAPVAVAPGQQGAPQNGRRLLDMDIRVWLKELEFEAHIDTFLAEEIDMSLVHALNEDDLRTLGITDFLAQRRFLSAARKAGEEVAAAKRAKRAASTILSRGPSAPGKLAGSGRGEPSGLPKQKKQKTLHLPGMVSRPPAASLAALNSVPGQGRALDGKKSNDTAKPVEQALLSALYPGKRKTAHLGYTTGAAGADELENEALSPQPTPPLPPPAALATSRVAHSASLFASAARCEAVTASLESRLEKKRSGQAPGAASEPLARGGISFSRVEEDRALKLMKLRALRDELRTHEATVVELKRLIGEMEADLGPGIG